MKKPTDTSWSDDIWLTQEFVEAELTRMGWPTALMDPRGMMVKRVLSRIRRSALSAKTKTPYRRFARSMRFQFPRKVKKGALNVSSIQRFLASNYYQGQVYKIYLTLDYTTTEYHLDLKQLRIFIDAVVEAHQPRATKPKNVKLKAA